ncbi:MAG: FliH/SctL family protein [Planctomycetaceae bacterium]
MPSESSPSGLAGFNFEDISQQAHQRLAECRVEVARLLAAAKAEADQLRAAAKQEGLTQGRELAQREADQNLQAALQQRLGQHATAVKTMVQQIATQHDQWIKQYADTLVSLVIEISERVIRAKLDKEPEILLRWAADALTSARSAQRLTVAVHPETLAELGKDLDELLRTPGLPEDATLVPDESVARSGVIVRQLGGEVDAGLNTQLEMLCKLLEGAA